MLAPGDQFTIEWVVVGHANIAAAYGFPIEVDAFVAPDDEYAPDDPDRVALMVEQDWLDDADNRWVGYARQYIDGTAVDREVPERHPRIKSLGVQ